MSRYRTRKHVGIGVVLACIAITMAACGGSSTKSVTKDTIDAAISKDVTDALAGSTTTTAPGTVATLPAKRPTTMDEWETLWASERAAVIKRIKDGKFGKSADGKTLTGPDDLKIDLSKCAAGWSDTEGLTDDAIKISHVAPLSGTAADFGNLPRGMTVMLDYYAAKGAFKDINGKNRKINFVLRDDGYDSARTIPLVDEMLDAEKAFIIMTTGSPTSLKVYDKLNQRCVPEPFIVGGHPAWGDPVNHPWSTGLTLAYTTEAVLWGAFIEKNVAQFTNPKIVVTSIVAKSDFGAAYDNAFKAFIAQSSLKDRIDYQPQYVDIAAPTVTNEMTTIASKNPDVFITMTGATQCPQIVNETAQNGMKQKTKIMFMSSVCKGASFVGKDKVGGDGSQSTGWWIVGGGTVDYNSPAEDSNAFVKWARELLATKNYDYKLSGGFGLGFTYGFPMVQALIIAGALDGGLTRSNYMLALRTLDMTNPGLIAGMKFNLSGAKDAYLVEGSEIAQYDATKQSWIPQGPIIELSGKSKNCAYDANSQLCK